MVISERSEEKKKSLVSTHNTKDTKSHYDMDTNENLSKAIMFLGKKLNQLLNMEKTKPNVQEISLGIRKNIDDQRRVITINNSNCKIDKEVTKKAIALTGSYESHKDACNEDLTYEELVVSYKELCKKSEEVSKLSETHKRS